HREDLDRRSRQRAEADHGRRQGRRLSRREPQDPGHQGHGVSDSHAQALGESEPQPEPEPSASAEPSARRPDRPVKRYGVIVTSSWYEFVTPGTAALTSAM